MSGDTVTTVGTVLTNIPMAVSMPSTSTDRPETTDPKTVVAERVWICSVSAHAAWTTVFSVIDLRLARFASSAVTGAERTVSAVSGKDVSSGCQPPATRVGSVTADSGPCQTSMACCASDSAIRCTKRKNVSSICEATASGAL